MNGTAGAETYADGPVRKWPTWSSETYRRLTKNSRWENSCFCLAGNCVEFGGWRTGEKFTPRSAPHLKKYVFLADCAKRERGGARTVSRRGKSVSDLLTGKAVKASTGDIIKQNLQFFHLDNTEDHIRVYREARQAHYLRRVQKPAENYELCTTTNFTGYPMLHGGTHQICTCREAQRSTTVTLLQPCNISTFQTDLQQGAQLRVQPPGSCWMPIKVFQKQGSMLCNTCVCSRRQPRIELSPPPKEKIIVTNSKDEGKLVTFVEFKSFAEEQRPYSGRLLSACERIRHTYNSQCATPDFQDLVVGIQSFSEHSETKSKSRLPQPASKLNQSGQQSNSREDCHPGGDERVINTPTSANTSGLSERLKAPPGEGLVSMATDKQCRKAILNVIKRPKRVLPECKLFKALSPKLVPCELLGDSYETGQNVKTHYLQFNGKVHNVTAGHMISDIQDLDNEEHKSVYRLSCPKKPKRDQLQNLCIGNNVDTPRHARGQFGSSEHKLKHQVLSSGTDTSTAVVRQRTVTGEKRKQHFSGTNKPILSGFLPKVVPEDPHSEMVELYVE